MEGAIDRAGGLQLANEAIIPLKSAILAGGIGT
jgi:hypothetical protein